LARCIDFRRGLLAAFSSLNPGPVFNGDPARTAHHVLNVSFPGIDSEALMVALKDTVAISNGSACTSRSYEPSHVLRAMGLPKERIKGAVRLSWCHMTENPDWNKVVRIITSLR
jgi:cysteine desulfurase